MISESQTRYGSRVFCHGSAWRPCCFCQATTCSAKCAPGPGRSLTPRLDTARASSLALLHLLDRHRVVEERQIELDESGVGGQRRGEGMLAQRLGELHGAYLVLLQALVLGVDLADPRLQL